MGWRQLIPGAAALCSVVVGIALTLGATTSAGGTALGLTDESATLSRAPGATRDSVRTPMSIDDLVAARTAVLDEASESISDSQAEAALDARRATLTDSAEDVSAEADRLRNLEDFLWPTAGGIASAYGMRFHPILHYSRLHDGDDIGGACGQPIYAAQGGTVVKAVSGGYNGGSGTHVRIDHGDIDGHEIQTSYLHMSKIIVEVGDVVKKGEQIGTVGSTGLSTACHLHLSLSKDGRSTNPQRYLDKPARTDVKAVAAAAAAARGESLATH